MFSYLHYDGKSWIYTFPDNSSISFVIKTEMQLNQKQSTKYSVFVDQHNPNIFHVLDLNKITKSHCLFTEFSIKIIEKSQGQTNTIILIDINNSELAGIFLAEVITSTEKSDHLAIVIDSRETLRKIYDVPNL